MFFRKASPKPAPPAAAAEPGPPGGVSRLINPAGRIPLDLLRELAGRLSAAEFEAFLRRPVLAGSGILEGTLGGPGRGGSPALNRTVLFQPAEDAAAGTLASESLRTAIYPLVKGAHAAARGEIFTIGRVAGCDLILPDPAVSKEHARIEVRREAVFLEDLGSTNGTWVNGRRLGRTPVALNDRDRVGFARYGFHLLYPASLQAMLRPQETAPALTR